MPSRRRKRADCGKAWGWRLDKLCESRNFMHRNFRLTQENVLWHSAILRSSPRGSRERRPLDREPRVHLAVGPQREIREVLRVARRKVGFSGRCGGRVTARAASGWAALRLSRPLGDAGCLPRRPCGARSRARLSGCGSRLVVGALREMRASPDPSPGRCRRRRRPARTLQAVGQAHPFVESGSRQRLLERRQRRSRGRSGASLLWRDAKRRRRRAPAVALATAKARTPNRLARSVAAPQSARSR